MIARKKEKEQKEKRGQIEQEELQEDVLDEVSGAGNPFEDIPRVPTQPIDVELRKKA